ncbi:MAG: ABC transporter ATP-binding protein [Oligosphaeraceae bacterium]
MLSCTDLRVWYPIRRGVFQRVTGHVHAVDGVSLRLNPGETLGLVGESGCGKTTLGRTLVGLEPPTAGQVFWEGKPLDALPARERKSVRRNLQMIFQDPFSSLDPRMSAMELVTEGLQVHGLYLPGESRQEAAARLMREVGLEPDTMFRYPHEFSGGQRQRLSIARAISLEPRVVVCDEPVSALDVSVQAQVIRLLAQLQKSRGLSYLFISHDLSVVRLLAQRVAVMYLGRVVEEGPAQEVLQNPLHPYTQALVSAIPVPGKSSRSQRILLKGELPSPSHPPVGCPFHPRCPYAREQCSRERPPLAPAGARRTLACWKTPSPGNGGN